MTFGPVRTSFTGRSSPSTVQSSKRAAFSNFQ